MNAREKLEAATDSAWTNLMSAFTYSSDTVTRTIAAGAIVQAAAAAGIFAKAEAPKGNAGPLTDAELFGVDLSAEGKAYADLKPNECIGDYPPAKLPWRPIAELPSHPDGGRQFAFRSLFSTFVMFWGGTQHWHGYSYPMTDEYARSQFTHFLELTPP